jgi:hypothetical protein
MLDPEGECFLFDYIRGRIYFSFSLNTERRLLSRENRRHEKEMSFYFLIMLRIAVGSNALDRRSVSGAYQSANITVKHQG